MKSYSQIIIYQLGVTSISDVPGIFMLKATYLTLLRFSSLGTGCAGNFMQLIPAYNVNPKFEREKGAETKSLIGKELPYHIGCNKRNSIGTFDEESKKLLQISSPLDNIGDRTLSTTAQRQLLYKFMIFISAACFKIHRKNFYSRILKAVKYRDFQKVLSLLLLY